MKNVYWLIQGDCLEALPRLEDESIDLIFSDPPYNIGVDYGHLVDDRRPDYYIWCYKWLDECIRVLKNTGSLFIMNLPRNLAYIHDYLDGKIKLVNWIAWIRNDNQLYSKERMLKPNHQDILWYVKSSNYKFNWKAIARKPIWFKDKRVRSLAGQWDTWSDITYVKGNSTEKTMVPNQLPVKLLERIIKATTLENDWVLDPFTGSGTTIVACQHLRRNCIGIEINPDYCEVVKKRCFGRQFLDREVEYRFTVIGE
ncbi:MAG: DNA-methyltransferase [Candidatus Thorarchaeota archaeon]